MKKNELKGLKEEIKKNANYNRILKGAIKEKQKGKGSGAAWREQGKLSNQRITTRALLRAYAELRGIPLEVIEPKARKMQESDYIYLALQKKTKEYVEYYSKIVENSVEEAISE